MDDERSNWAKEVLDASMAMWWWPDPDVDEFGQMMADPPVHLHQWNSTDMQHGLLMSMELKTMSF